MLPCYIHVLAFGIRPLRKDGSELNNCYQYVINVFNINVLNKLERGQQPNHRNFFVINLVGGL